jgi:Putative Actinobacterial Holin-X, holin superfamily III
MSSPNNRTIPELFSDAFGQLAKLVGNEFELARAEISQKANQVGKATALIGAGAVVLIPALVVILFGIASALIRSGISDPAAYLLTGCVTALVAVGLIWIGINRLSGDALKPTVTMEQLHRDKVAAKELVR